MFNRSCLLIFTLVEKPRETTRSRQNATDEKMGQEVRHHYDDNEKVRKRTRASKDLRELLLCAGLKHVKGIGDLPRPVPSFHELRSANAETQ